MHRKTDNHYVRELEQEKMILEEINAHLEKMEKEQQNMFSILNQDIRTPLVTIKAYTDMLIEEKFGVLTKTQSEKLILMKENIELLINALFKTIEKNRIIHEHEK